MFDNHEECFRVVRDHAYCLGSESIGGMFNDVIDRIIYWELNHGSS